MTSIVHSRKEEGFQLEKNALIEIMSKNEKRINYLESDKDDLNKKALKFYLFLIITFCLSAGIYAVNFIFNGYNNGSFLWKMGVMVLLVVMKLVHSFWSEKREISEIIVDYDKELMDLKQNMVGLRERMNFLNKKKE